MFNQDDRSASLAEFDAGVRRLPFSVKVVSVDGGVRVFHEYATATYCMVE